MIRKFLKMVVPAVVLAGCASYTWTSSIPVEMRTISVPTFRNESKVTELGNVVARQILREVQREGTFRIGSADDAVLEIQGVVKSAESSHLGSDRSTGQRNSIQSFSVQVVVSVIDHKNGKVLMDNRVYEASVPFGSSGDLMTGMRNASGRVAEEIAARVMDDVLALKF